MCVRATRRWQSKEEEEEERKNPRITKESLRRICKEQKLYITPHLNDVLYLHYKGYSKIENLEEYTGLKCLWLENNGIDKIENLDNQKDLRNLYLHNNLIKEIENLEGACPLLDSLNLCHNSVSKIQNLSRLEHLHTLHISHNRLQDFADVEHLKECKELSCVDLQHNWLDDPNIIYIFEEMQSLRVLYLTGNPVVKKIPSYRKNLTVRCKKLTYLDDRPVFPKDRAAAEAWNEGGLEAEKACRKKWAEEERAKIDASVKGLLALRDKAKAAKFKAEMEELFPELEKKQSEEDEDEGKEEEDEEEEEEAEDAGEEPPHENLEAGDSEEVAHNGIIFPWNLESDVRSRNRNELGEGGRSLIVELPDPTQPETKQVKSVARKGPIDPEIKNKLQIALVSAEGLQEKHQEETLAGPETKPEIEAVAEEPLHWTPSPPPEATEVPPMETIIDAKTIEDVSRDEEIEKGTLDNLLKEKEFAYERYVKKTEEEILPNISHFSFGRKPPEEEEKNLGKEIEELLRVEIEEMKKERESRQEMSGGSEVSLIEMERNTTTRVGAGAGMVSREMPSGDYAVVETTEEVPKDVPRKEVVTSTGFFEDKELIDEKEATKALDFGAKVVEELRVIGSFPLREKEAADSSSDSSSREEFQDPEGELPLADQFSSTPSPGRGKLESPGSEEYYSLLAEEEVSQKGEGERMEGTTGFETPGDDAEAPNGLSEKDGEEALAQYEVGEEPPPEDSHIRTYKRDIKSSIELQLVTEKDAEEPEQGED